MIEVIATIVLGIGAVAVLYYLLSAFIELKIFEETKDLSDKVNRIWDECYKQRAEINNLIIECSIDRTELTEAIRKIRKIREKRKIK